MEVVVTAGPDQKQASVSTAQIACRLGVSRRQVIHLENGTRQWNPDCLFAYATICKHDIILLLAEIERWFSMKPDQGEAATKVAKKLHVEVNPIRVARRELGLSASDFAYAVGCDRFCVYKTETGLTFPQKMTLSRFAEVLKKDLAELEEALKTWKRELEEGDAYEIIQHHIQQQQEGDNNGDQPAGETRAQG